MNDFKQFARAIFSHWLTLMSGCLVIVLVGIFERVKEKNIPWSAYAALTSVLIVVASFLVWRDKKRELEQTNREKEKEIEQLRSELGSERDVVRREFNALRARILASSLIHVISKELGSTREFLLRNPQLLSLTDFQEFYKKWISPHEIHIEYGAELNLNKEQYLEMKRDLIKLQL